MQYRHLCIWTSKLQTRATFGSGKRIASANPTFTWDFNPKLSLCMKATYLGLRAQLLAMREAAQKVMAERNKLLQQQNAKPTSSTGSAKLSEAQANPGPTPNGTQQAPADSQTNSGAKSSVSGNTWPLHWIFFNTWTIHVQEKDT